MPFPALGCHSAMIGTQLGSRVHSMAPLLRFGSHQLRGSSLKQWVCLSSVAAFVVLSTTQSRYGKVASSNKLVIESIAQENAQCNGGEVASKAQAVGCASSPLDGESAQELEKRPQARA